MHRYPDILFESQSLTVLINSALYPKTTKIQTKKSSDTQPATRAPRVASSKSRASLAARVASGQTRVEDLFGPTISLTILTSKKYEINYKNNPEHI